LDSTFRLYSFIIYKSKKNKSKSQIFPRLFPRTPYIFPKLPKKGVGKAEKVANRILNVLSLHPVSETIPLDYRNNKNREKYFTLRQNGVSEYAAGSYEGVIATTTLHPHYTTLHPRRVPTSLANIIINF